jgi:hypothetical protein
MTAEGRNSPLPNVLYVIHPRRNDVFSHSRRAPCTGAAPHDQAATRACAIATFDADDLKSGFSPDTQETVINLFRVWPS